MKYQEFCVRQMESALNCGLVAEDYAKTCYTYALKNGLIGLYAETYEFEGSEIKFWDLNYSSRGKKGKRHLQGKQIWRNLLASVEAVDVCERNENGEKQTKKGKTAPYYEHLEPRSVTYKRLISLAQQGIADYAHIKEVLDQSKLVILTYAQQEVLDKSVFTVNDEDLLRTWLQNGKIDCKTAEDALNSIKSSKGKFRSCKDNGVALARFAHLITTQNMRFSWGNDSTSESIDLFLRYMHNSDHTIN